MKTKKFLPIVAVVCAVLFSACSASTVITSSLSSSETPPVTPFDTRVRFGDDSQRSAPGRQEDENMLIGKIAAVSADKITLLLASAQRPEGDAQSLPSSRPERDGSQATSRPERNDSQFTSRPERDSKQAASRPQPDASAGATADASRPERTWGGMNMTFESDETVYEFSSDISIKKSRDKDDGGEALTVADLAADDVVRIELGDDGKVSAIFVLTDDFAAGWPKEALKSAN